MGTGNHSFLTLLYLWIHIYLLMRISAVDLLMRIPSAKLHLKDEERKKIKRVKNKLV